MGKKLTSCAKIGSTLLLTGTSSTLGIPNQAIH